MTGHANEVYLFRDIFTPQSSHGEFVFENDCERFAYTIEDTVRAEGIKVHGHTAIKGGTESAPEWYNLTLHFSSKFNREVVMLSNTEKVNIIKHGNIIFSYVYVHGGNRHADSLGCILTAKNRNIKADSIQETQEKAFTKRVKEMLAKGPVRLGVINKSQDN